MTEKETTRTSVLEQAEAAETDEHGESRAQRSARLDQERKALRSGHPDALGSRILRLVAGFDVYDVHTGGDRLYPPEHQMAKAAAALVKAVALAVANTGVDASTSLTFDDQDVVVALGAISCYLHEGVELMLDVRSETPEAAQ